LQSTITLHTTKSGSRLLTIDEIHIIANYLHLNCAEYGLQKWFKPPQRVRVNLWHTTILWQSLLTWLTASDVIRVLSFDIHLSSSEYGFKHNLGQIKKFVCFVWLSISIEHGLESW